MPFNQDDKEKLNRLEDIKTKLFSKNYLPRIQRHDVFGYKFQKEVPESWKTEKGFDSESSQQFFMKTSMFKKFFIFAIVFFVCAVGFAVYTFLGGGNTVSNANIDFSFFGNSFTAGGEDLPLQIEITNKNNLPLQLA